MKSSTTNDVQDRIKKNAALYGYKTANLMELEQLCSSITTKKIKVKVPAISPIADQAIQHHLDTYAKEWREVWEKFITLQGKQKNLTDEGRAVLKSLRKLIKDCFNQHSFNADCKLPLDMLYMVRSSGDEDRIEIANPGGNKSVSAVKLDAASLSSAISTVAASYFSEKSLTQRLLSDDDIHKAFMPVLIQAMVGEKLNGFDDPKKILISGVMYAKEQGITCLDSAFGHGETIVNSKAPFDTFEVTRDNVVHAAIHHKKRRLVPMEVQAKKNKVTRKLVFKDNPKKLQHAPSLSAEIASEIADVGRQIAKHYHMPKDIEWVFEPETNTLYLVQSRPITQGAKPTLMPSTIAPDQWKLLKKDPDVELSKTPVITPARKRAKVVSQDTVILAGDIASALNGYLKKSEKKQVDSVVVKEPAPRTSHEAAQFNFMDIPVYQGPVEVIDRWLKENKSVVVADPQHQYFVNMTKKLHEQVNPEKALQDDKTLVEGLYVSSLSTQKTLLPGFAITNDIVQANIKRYLSNHHGIEKIHTLAKNKKIYSTLLDCIETIESAKTSTKNDDAFEALQTIADIFKVIATSTQSRDKKAPHHQLFAHAMLSIAEIDHCLSDFSKLSESSEEKQAKQQELLDLISKLKAVVINPGDTDLYSDSIHQIAVQNHTRQTSDDTQLSDSQRSYFVEFRKLKALALNETTEQEWVDFSYDCAKTPLRQQMLSQIIMFAIENDSLSELINYHLLNTREFNEDVIVSLYELIDKNRDEFKRYHIDENNQMLVAWENRINEWSNPKKFDKLFKEFHLEMEPLISSLKLENDMSDFTQQIILKQVARLTEIIDKSIKTMKASVEYQGQEKTLVAHFGALLISYHQLMRNWMNAVPDDFYKECAASIKGDNYYNQKDKMLGAIDECFRHTLHSSDPNELNASGYLSVASAKLGSNASFLRQFVEHYRYFRLEDYFSLFHQNILECIAVLNKKFLPKVDDLPTTIKPLVTEILKTTPISLLHITHHHPVIELEFNVPLDNHSMKFVVAFDTTTKSLVLHVKCFGRNWAQRMNLIGDMARIEGLLLGDMLQKPTYNTESLSLEFSWQFSPNDMPYLAQHIQAILSHYIRMIDNDSLTGVAYRDLKNNLAKILERHSVDSIISADIVKHMSLEKRQELVNKMMVIDKSILVKDFIKNPDEMFSLLKGREIVSQTDIFDNMASLNMSLLEKLMNHVKFDFSDKRSDEFGDVQTYLERLIVTWSADEAIKFLSKYKPDLKEHPKLFQYLIAACRDPYRDAELFEFLFAHEAVFDLPAVNFVWSFPGNKSYAIQAMEKWDKTELSNWIYNNAVMMDVPDATFRLTMRRILEHFASKIDFNNKPLYASAPLFEYLILSSCFKGMRDTEFNDFLITCHIDIAKQPNALNLLFIHERSLAMSILKNNIANHVLEPDVLEHLSINEIAPLLVNWSADELKSWMDSHPMAQKMKLHPMRCLYFSKLIHQWDPTLPEELDLSFRTAFKCFHDPNLKPKLLDSFTQWDKDDKAYWLINVLKGVTLQPEWAEFITALQPNFNYRFPRYSVEPSLFECIMPLFDDEHLISIVKESPADFTESLSIAIANNKLNLAWFLLEEKAKDHSLTASDLLAMKPCYSTDKILSLFNHWNRKEVDEWLSFHHVPPYLVKPFMDFYQSKFPDLPPIFTPKDVNLNSLEDMLEYCFKDTVVGDRIKHIKIEEIGNLQTFVEFTDSDKPLSKAQKECIFDFFKRLGLENWRNKTEDTYRFSIANGSMMMGHGPRMDLFVSKEKLTALVKKDIREEFDFLKTHGRYNLPQVGFFNKQPKKQTYDEVLGQKDFIPMTIP